MIRKNHLPVLGALAAACTLLGGCYGYSSYSSYYNSAMNSIPRTTAAKDTLEEFDVSSLQAADGTFQFQSVAWGSSIEDLEKVLGAEVAATQAFSDGGGYGNMNYSILLLDHESVSLMPVYDDNGGLTSIGIYFESVYTAEELDSFYEELAAYCETIFGEPDRVSPASLDSNGTTYDTETTFWYHDVSETQRTTLQVGKVDSGNGTDAVVLGINTYNPQEVEEETTLEESFEETLTEIGSEADSAEETSAQ